MRLDPYPEKSGMRVWLSREELSQLLDVHDDPKKRVAMLLAGRCGLRRSEVVQVAPKDFVSGPTGDHVRIWEDYAKREHYREPPVPDEVSTTVTTMAYGQAEDEPVIDVPAKYIYRWVQSAAKQMMEKTGDEGWQYVGPHDLRRTWGTDLLEQGVVPSMVMSWGGWEDWETFRRHYLGEFSVEGLQRERAKVDYLGGTGESEGPQLVVPPSSSTPARN